MDHSAGGRVLAIVLVFGAIALVLLGMIFLQGRLLDDVRVYVHGEGLWAKAQKDALLHLELYANSRAEAEYRAFQQAIDVTLGDRQARLALLREPPDLEAARAGFLRGRNHPDDIDSAIWFFRNFRFISSLRDATAIWTAGDAKIDELIEAGASLHAASRAQMPAAAMAGLHQRLLRLNDELLVLEDRFSNTLSAGARWASGTFWLGSLALCTALLAFGGIVSRQIVRSIGRSEAQLRLAGTVFAASRDGVLITDPELAIIAANQALCEMTGWRAGELTGQTPRIFRSGHTSEERYREMWAALNAKGNWQGELIDRRRDGAALPVRVSISGVTDARGRLTHYVAIIADISESKAHEDRLRHLAHHDALTGLPNRVLFSDRIEQLAKDAARNGSRFAVLFLDLDEFKPVNDRYGHEVGDKLLRLVAGRLTGCLRGSDTVTRLGGDEFAVLLPDIEGKASGEEIVSKLVEAIRAPYYIDGPVIEISASIGMSLYPDEGKDLEALMRLADLAMYEAKTASKAAAGPAGRTVAEGL